MKKKTTRKALLMSVVSMLLCVSMLVGSTFAWFTDSVTATNNVIVAGNLDVELYNDVDTNDDTKLVVPDTKLFEEVKLWEPGAVAYENLTVANVGTLALKYQLSVNFKNENATTDGYKLSDILTVAVVEGGITGYTDDDAGRQALIASITEWLPLGTLLESGSLTAKAEGNDTETYGIVIYWKPSASDNNWNLNNGRTTNDGRDYLAIDLGINLVATQLVHEEDSFGPDYDVDATYELSKDDDGTYLIYSPTDLMGFNAKMNASGFNGEGNRLNFKLMGDIDMQGADWLSVNEMFMNFDGNGYTISNLNCVENGNKSGLFGYLGGGSIKNLTLKNVTSTGSQAGIFAGQAEGTSIINCNVEGVNTVAWDDDSADAITKNGVGVYVGVSVESNTTSGTIAEGTVINLVTTGMNSAASGVWAKNDKYVGGLFTETQTVNIVDNSAAVNTLEYVSEGLYRDATTTKSVYYVTSGKGLASFAEWRNSTVVTEGNPYNAWVTLLNDVDMAGVTFNAINGQHTVIDGNGFTIKNLNAGQGISGKGGLVSYFGGGLIKDLTLEDATVTGCQVGLFAGQSEYGKIENCFVKGDNIVIWSQNTTDSYVETWNGIGAIVGYCSGGTFNVEICEGATVTLDKNVMTSQGTYNNDLTGYGLDNSGTVVNNGTVTTLIAASDVNVKGVDVKLTAPALESIVYNRHNADTVSSIEVYNTDDLKSVMTLIHSGVMCANGVNGINAVITFKNDIDFGGADWNAIGKDIDIVGNGHVLSNVNFVANANGQAGLYSYSGNCDVDGLTLKDVTSTGSQAGAFAGNATNTHLTNCALAGTITINWTATAEEYNGVGAVFGVTSNMTNTVGVDVSEANIVINNTGITYPADYAPEANQLVGVVYGGSYSVQ